MVKMYGIPNCDVIKKALKFFNNHKIPVEFHDYKKEGISDKQLQRWCQVAGWENIFNKRSTTWKEIMQHEKVESAAEAIPLMLQHTSIIKRPIVEANGKIIVGYNENAYKQLIK